MPSKPIIFFAFSIFLLVEVFSAGSFGAEVLDKPEAELFFDGTPYIANDAKLSPDGSKLVVYLGGLFIYDLKTMTKIKVLKYGGSPDWSPDGTKLAIQDVRDVAVKIFDTTTWMELKKINLDGLGSATRWSPDGKKLAATARNYSANAPFDNYVVIWDTNSWKEINRFSFDDVICCTPLIWKPDSSLFITSGKVFNVASGALINNVKQTSDLCSSDGKRMVFTNSTNIFIQDIFTEKKYLDLEGKILNSGSLNGMWSPDCNLYAEHIETSANGIGKIVVWNTNSGAVFKILSAHNRSINSLHWSRDSSMIVSTGIEVWGDNSKSSVKLWKVREPTSLVSATTTTSHGSGGDLIPVIDEAKNITLKAFYRGDLDDSLTEARALREGVALPGVKEGDMVAFVPEGNTAGKKVEWFDEWNGKKYKISNAYFIKKELHIRNTYKLEAFSDPGRTTPTALPKAGDVVYFRLTKKDPLTGELVRESIGQISAFFFNENGFIPPNIFTKSFDVNRGGVEFNGLFEDQFTVPSTFPEGSTIRLNFAGIEFINIIFNGSASSASFVGNYSIKKLSYETIKAFGIAGDVERVVNNKGIYRTFAVGTHKISMVVDGAEKGSISLEVGPASASETKNIGVVLTLFDGVTPNRCGDGRDREGDGFTGYGKNDDCDGWDSYEYTNLLFSRVSKYYSEASKGRLRFDWKIFDNNGKWVYVKPPLVGGNPGLAAAINEAFKQAGQENFDGIKMTVLSRDTINRISEAAGLTDPWGNIAVVEASLLLAPAHELGHHFFGAGLPMELYPSGAPFGFASDIKQWGVMHDNMALSGDFPPLMDAWSRMRIGWASEDLKTKDGTYKLDRYSDKILAVRTTPIFSYVLGTRYLLEARSQASKLTYFDRGAPSTGVVVYRVNSFANRRDQITVENVLRNEGDKTEVTLAGTTASTFKLKKENLLEDGTAEVEIGTGAVSNLIGAAIDGAGQAAEAVGNAAESVADKAEDAGKAVSDFFGGLVGGKSAPASEERTDLDLHAYYTYNGQKYHIGMNYSNSEYEMQTWAKASGDLLGAGEFILVPDKATDIQFKVVNKKLRAYFEKHPEALKVSDGTEKYSIVYLKFDSAGKRTLTNPEINSISLNENEKTNMIPTIGFSVEQTIPKITEEKLKQRAIVLRGNEVLFSQEFVGDSKPKIPESIFSKNGNYTIIHQSAGPTNELHENDVQIKESYQKFAADGRKEKDNYFDVLNLKIESPASVAIPDNTIYIFGGAAVLIVILGAVFFLRKKKEAD